MWHRNENRPTDYAGIRFRSALEARAAKDLDALGVTWQYEQAVTDPSTSHPIGWYLPDFTITHADPDLEMPRWLEVKPADLLYRVRDHLGCPEHFDGTHNTTADARSLHDAQLTEIWKPKRLAEITGQPVLVAYQLNATRSLSLLMLPNRIQFSKAHPTVNRKGVLARRQREEDQRRWQAEYERHQAEREQEERQWRQHVIAYAAAHGQAARFGDRCVICRQNEAAEAITIFRNADNRWTAVCISHLSTEAAGRCP